MNFVHRLTTAAIVTALLSACGFQHDEVGISPGAIMSIKNGEGGYSIIKILVADDSLVHLRIYKGTHNERPATVGEKDLQLGSITDPEGIGIGHVSQKEFQLWEPHLIVQDSVKMEELEGYEIWKEQSE